MHLTPADLPSGIPGIGDEIESAIQQAPQFSRQFISQIYQKLVIHHNQLCVPL
jgi:hypothetical protein